MVNIIGIVINVIMVVWILLLVFFIIKYKNNITECETKQSPFCYNIKCPCDNDGIPPCFGFAKSAANGTDRWYCSNSPDTIVDGMGNPVS